MEEKIKKLPKWAQALIQKLRYERNTAIDALNEYCDNQTLSAFFYDDMLCTGETKGISFKRKYVQSRKIDVKYQGILLGVTCQDDGIRLVWEDEARHGKQIAFIPQSYQSACLISQDNMRR